MGRPVFENCPLLMPALCLALGIVLGGELLQGWPAAALLVTVVMTTLLLSRWPLLQSLGILVCFVVLGMAVSPVEEDQVPDGVWTEAVVASPLVDKPKTLMAELILVQTGERRRCFIWKDERSQCLDLGDNLLVCIEQHQFVRRDGWKSGGDGFSRLSDVQRLRIRALRWRGALVKRLTASSEDHDAQAVLAAMVLGDKSSLSKELRETYSVTGASHILALSGLHLGIIYLLLMRLTMGRRRFWLTQIVVVLAIWAFALITGLSVSVVRAATMISIYALFSLGGRHHAPLAVLSFTAIVMLLLNSRSLFDVGFQLSFMSMLGILLFSPRFEAFVSVKWLMTHRLARCLFALTVISLSAQLGTAPLVAYHFGRFSPYFLLTNFLVIPAATLILYGAIVVLAFPITGGVLLAFVNVLNGVLGWMSRLPGASIEGLQPSWLQVALVYVVEAILYYLLWSYQPRISQQRRK